jgi:hypothetical protein
MKKFLIAAAMTAAMTGCATVDQCANYGFQPGSQGYAQCRMDLQLQAQQQFQQSLQNMANQAQQRRMYQTSCYRNGYNTYCTTQ